MRSDGGKLFYLSANSKEFLTVRVLLAVSEENLQDKKLTTVYEKVSMSDTKG